MMLERNDPIHSVVFFDTGWEFPEMAAHVDLVERNTGLKIVRLSPPKSFNYWMLDRRVVAQKGEMRGEVHKIGYGWPYSGSNWCTKIKTNALDKYSRTVVGAANCIGIAADEKHREKPGEGKIRKRYPLIEYNKTETDCLEYCKNLGYNWGGLYDIFDRVSCWCCPFGGESRFRKLRKHRPKLWQKVIEMDMLQPRHSRDLCNNKTAVQLECQFRKEEKQGQLW